MAAFAGHAPVRKADVCLAVSQNVCLSGTPNRVATTASTALLAKNPTVEIRADAH
jgi:hypothetical protein